jgi:hypothetical protein
MSIFATRTTGRHNKRPRNPNRTQNGPAQMAHTEIVLTEIDNRPDSEVAAQHAVEALQAGRYDLGAAYARIAATAARMEREATVRNVPFRGTTRLEQPRTPTFDDLAREAAHGHEHASGTPDHSHDATAIAADYRQPLTDFERAAGVVDPAEQAKTAVFGQPVSPAMQVPRSARCRAMLGSPGQDGTTSIGECHRVVWWHDGGPTQEGPNLPPGWYHVEPEADQHHVAVVPQG